MFTLVFITLLSAADTIPAADTLAHVVRRATAASARHDAVPERYAAQAETEVAFVLAAAGAIPGGVSGTKGAMVEQAPMIEQVASRLQWHREGAFAQLIAGYRAQSIGATYSALSLLPRAWVVPQLAGDRFYFAPLSDSGRKQRDGTRQAPPMVVHPFARDAASFYDYSGADSGQMLNTGRRLLRIVRIHVEPRRAAALPGLLYFAGDVYVDADRGDLVRMRGRIGGGVVADSGRPPPLALRLMAQSLQLTGAAFVEFENQEVEGRWWLPRYQRVELQVTTALADDRYSFRLVTRVRDIEAVGRPVADSVATVAVGEAPPSRPALRPLPRVLSLPSDSLAAWRDWRRQLGSELQQTNATDFDDVGPARLRRTGSSITQFKARRPMEIVRFNRVEGLFTGGALLFRGRDAMPGLQVRANLGYAWSGQTFRGGVEGVMDRDRWLGLVRAERALTGTNDFLLPTDNGMAAFAITGIDEYDYVDRSQAVLGVSRWLDDGGNATLRVESGWARDAALPVAVSLSPIGQRAYRLNRPIAPGEYWLTTAVVDVGRRALGSLQTGVGAVLKYERGDGDVPFQRMELRVAARQLVGRWIATARVDLGTLLGEGRPPQRLFELGSTQGLPGYEYKAFAGDGAMLARGVLTYQLPFLAQPLRVARLTLPAIAPAPSIGVSSGATWSSAAGVPALQSLGWQTSGGARTTVNVVMRFFGGGVTAGVARPVDRGGAWRGLFTFGGQF